AYLDRWRGLTGVSGGPQASGRRGPHGQEGRRGGKGRRGRRGRIGRRGGKGPLLPFLPLPPFLPEVFVMRIPFIAGNWKMYKTVQEAVLYAKELRSIVKDVSDVEMVVAPPFTAIAA